MTPSFTKTSERQEQATLHLLSNFTVGETTLSHFWQEQITMLQQDALPFQQKVFGSVPTLTLDTETSLAPLFDYTEHGQVEQWPTWCTFISMQKGLSETFLLLSLTCRNEAMRESQSPTIQKYQLVLRFQHQLYLSLLEAIEQAGQVVVYDSSESKKLTIPFLVPELSLHLNYIRPLFR